MEITRLTLLAAFVTAFALALLFTPVAIKIAPKIGAIDVPKDGRRMHTKAMPRFGGLGWQSSWELSVLLQFMQAIMKR